MSETGKFDTTNILVVTVKARLFDIAFIVRGESIVNHDGLGGRPKRRQKRMPLDLR